MTTKKANREPYVTGTGTVTRSISFDADTWKWLEKTRKDLRVDRSTMLRWALEDVSGIRAHPELRVPHAPHPTLSVPATPDKGTIDQLLEKLLEQKLNALLARDAAKLKKSLDNADAE